jgi:hypothetical protein
MKKHSKDLPKPMRIRAKLALVVTKEFCMDAVVSAQGLTVPKRMLRGMHHVHIEKKQGMIIITPQAINDPLLGLGSAPARQSLTTGSQKHDQHIYSGR